MAKKPTSTTKPTNPDSSKGTSDTRSTRRTSTPRAPRTQSTPRPMSTPDPLDILFVTSEARPFGKTGGLADVCTALPLALARLGHRVTVVLPKYRGAPTDGAAGWAAEIPFRRHAYPVRFVEQTMAPGVTAVLIDAPALFDRAGLYGDSRGEFGDNAFRFAVLCRGALEYVRLKGTRPSVIH